MAQEPEITALLQSANKGDQQSLEQLFQIAYQELHRIAKKRRAQWQGNDTLNTTVLIHEAYLKLMGGAGQTWHSRNHFYAVASKAMRHVLVNYALNKKSQKRDGGEAMEMLDELLPDTAAGALDDLLAMHQALQALAAENPRWPAIVECRIFGGLTIEEAADALNISAATVSREWNSAMAALARFTTTESPPR